MDYTRIITSFLALNPEPSDDQVHALAAALGIDAEALEAEMYKMLGDKIEHRVTARLLKVSASQVNQVLVDGIDETLIPVSLMTVNDGTRNPEPAQRLQDAMADDGGLVEQNDQLFVDGLPGTI